MSHAQIPANAVILRHAWLSPWNKHMTTGRINQISIEILCCFCYIVLFWRLEKVRLSISGVLSQSCHHFQKLVWFERQQTSVTGWIWLTRCFLQVFDDLCIKLMVLEVLRKSRFIVGLHKDLFVANQETFSTSSVIPVTVCRFSHVLLGQMLTNLRCTHY
jgi:hypothetical protein